MSARVDLNVIMKLESDAVFGSGYSIPGGEDIAVVQDSAGYPCLPGTAVKGLLRESMENWLVWTGGSGADLDGILGESGWAGVTAPRRLTLTPMKLANPPAAPEDCYGFRTFTALEDGVVKTDTLRTASCVKRGLEFTGTITCLDQDVALVTSALKAIRWVGAMRSRGFGAVSFTVKPAAARAETHDLEAAGCIRYRLRTETPMFITDLARSAGNSYETQGLIPGSAVRGMVMSELAARNPAWFEEHRRELLLGVRFLDAVPLPKEGKTLEVLPSLKGFYADKKETVFRSVLLDSDVEGLKRAKLGSFCALDGESIASWKADTGGVTRIQRGVTKGEEETKPFQVRHLNEGQTLEGYIWLDNPALAPEIAKVFGDTVWIGADRYAGYGKCAVEAMEAVEQPGWLDAYGYRSQEEIGKELFLLAVSPMTMLNAEGEPCGLDTEALADLLGVGTVTLEVCSTSVTENGGYNRAWCSREPTLPMYERGSLFRLTCDCPPALERIVALQKGGLGARTNVGCGQVLFLRPELYRGLTGKKKEDQDQGNKLSVAALVRQKRYQWIIDKEKSGDLQKGGLSKSQLGTIQALCEKACASGGNTAELLDHLRKNAEDRGARHGNRYESVNELIHEVLDQPLAVTLKLKDTPCEDSVTARLELLCQLFNYSRRGEQPGRREKSGRGEEDQE